MPGYIYIVVASVNDAEVEIFRVSADMIATSNQLENNEATEFAVVLTIFRESVSVPLGTAPEYALNTFATSDKL